MGLILCVCIIHAQSPYDDEVCLDKTVKQIRNEEIKKRVVFGLTQTLKGFSYLSYSDRTVDRITSGKDVFEPYANMLIRKVEITVLKPYGVSIEQPTATQFTKFQKFANKSQIKTKLWVVENDLLFKAGDRVNPLLFADTERNLWERSTFKDLKIFVIPVEGSYDLVDVLVMVQDRWSWNITTSVAFNKVQAGVQFKNFLGIPQSISSYVSLNFRKDNLYTVHGDYLYENIKRTQIDVNVGYMYDNFTKGGFLKIKRDFFSSKSKWAGHFKAEIFRESSLAPNFLAAAIPTNVFYNTQDIWLATSINPKFKDPRFELMRFIVSSRIYRKDYLSRPFQRSSDRSLNFLNRFYFLGSIGFANWDYYVDHNVFYLGQAEYLNKGLNGAVILGFDRDEELQKRFYSGAELTYGKNIKRLGYINTKIGYGGFTKKNSYQQVLLQFNTKFFSDPIPLGSKFFMRQFISASANVGFNRPIGKELVVNSTTGIRGVFVDYIRGTRNYVFNFETTVYPNFKILGFNSCAFVFADIAVVQQNSIRDYWLTQAYGVGIRLRNLSMGIGFFEISFAYYPNLRVPNMKPFRFLGDFKNNREILQDNLFEPDILSTDR